MCYARARNYTSSLNLQEATRFDFPIRDEDRISMSTNQVDYDIFNYLDDMQKCVLVYEPSYNNNQYLLRRYNKGRVGYSIYYIYSVGIYSRSVHVKEVYRDELAANMKWADLNIKV